MKKILKAAARTLGPPLAAWAIRLIRLSMRLEYVNDGPCREFLREGGNIILAFWHGQLLMMPYSYFGSSGVTILVSQHSDGEPIARTVKRFGIRSVRGSTTRGWFGGFKAMLKTAHSGGDLAITPDGPRGPARVAQTGVIQLASKTGLPIVPVAFAAEKKKNFKSWDSFMVPHLFSRGALVYGDLVFIPKRLGAKGTEEARADLEKTLNTLTEEAGRRVAR